MTVIEILQNSHNDLNAKCLEIYKFDTDLISFPDVFWYQYGNYSAVQDVCSKMCVLVQRVMNDGHAAAWLGVYM